MKTFKIWQSFLILTVVVLMTAACNKKEEDLVLDFNVTVPENWDEFQQEYNGMVFYWANSPNNLEAGDTVNEGVTISREQLPDGYTLSGYYGVIKGKIDDNTGYALIAENLDTTIGAAECVKLVHKEIAKIIFNSKVPVDTVDTTVVSTKYFFVNGNYGYIVNFAALEETFEEFKPVFESIITSFSFKN